MTKQEKEKARELRDKLQKVREHLRRIGEEASEVYNAFDSALESAVREDEDDAALNCHFAGEAYEELGHHKKEAGLYCDAALETIRDLTGLHVEPQGFWH